MFQAVQTDVIPTFPKALYTDVMGSHWKNILLAVFCFGISVIAFITTWVDCTRHIGVNMGCFSQGLQNPYTLLCLLMLIGIAAASVRFPGMRKVLLWWGILLVLFGGWFFAFA